MAWYDKKWVIIVAIIIFFPVGLIMMWRTPNFGTKTKVIVTGIFALLIIGSWNQQTTTNQQPSTVKNEQPARQAEPPAKQYAAVDANTLMNDLARNAAAAQKKYKGQLICVTGRVGVIDSDGDYILVQSDDEFAMTGISCEINSRDKAQEDFVLNVSMGQYIKAYGEVVDVGEVVGYRLKVDKFEQ